MSEAIKCTKCGSSYVEYKNTEESKKGKHKHYYCQGCQSSFTITEQRELPKGKKIATLYDGGGWSASYIEIYQDKNGNVGTLSCEKEKHYAVEFHSPKFYVEENMVVRVGDKVLFPLRVSTFAHKNDKSGILLTIEKIVLDDEYIKEALKNDAMRAAYREKEKAFILKDNHNHRILTDIALWLNSLVGTSQISGTDEAVDAKKKRNLGVFVSLFPLAMGIIFLLLTANGTFSAPKDMATYPPLGVLLIIGGIAGIIASYMVWKKKQ